MAAAFIATDIALPAAPNHTSAIVASTGLWVSKGSGNERA